MSAVTKRKKAAAADAVMVRPPFFALCILCTACVIAPLLAGIPDETPWTSIVCALALLAGAATVLQPLPGAGDSAPRRIASWSVLGLVAASAISLAARWLLRDHGSAQYLDAMMRGLTYWTALAALLRVSWIVSSRRMGAYAVAVVLIATAGVAGAMGLQDYLINVLRNHIPNWREFGTSTPDYFAGYLLITIPITLALYLGAPSESGKRMSWLFGFAFLLQVAVLPTTGSRFALVSFVFSIALFAIVLFYIRKDGFVFTGSMRLRLTLLACVAVIGSALFIGPVAHRLEAGTMAQQSNSGDFRVWTWRGAVRLAEHHPLFGSGPGMFVYEYPKYAIVGFTRVAHSGYLQVLDDLGAFGLIALLLVFAGSLGTGWLALRAAASTPSPHRQDAFLANVAAPDDRLLAVGLISGIAAALLQNVIDTDWSMTLCGVTLFVAIGLLLGISTAPPEPPAAAPPVREIPWRLARVSAGVVALLLGAVCCAWSAAGFAAASGDLGKAASLARLNGSYKSDLAWKAELPAGDWQQAERNLNLAVALTPDPVAYYRLAMLDAQTRRPQLALANIKAGLAYDPNSLELLLNGARIAQSEGDISDAFAFYQKMATLQDSPYGTVRAITGFVEYRYAYADYALGTANSNGYGIAYLKKAQQILQEYADEGGSSNALVADLTGTGSPELDSQLQSLYESAMQALESDYRARGDVQDAAAAASVAQTYIPRFVHTPKA